MVTVTAESELTKTLSEMKQVYMENPEKAVRSKQFIQKLQEYCASELKKRVDASNVKTKTEVKLQTPYSAKRVDVVSIMVDNGPVIAISVKSQMSSTMKNFIHYYEGVVGDVTALHRRFPFASIGMLWLFPLKPIKEGRTTESTNFKKIEKMFKMATGRKQHDDDVSKHECFCMLVVDFNTEPPTIVNDHPESDDLKIDCFFGRLVSIFRDRTPGLY